jgi:hypothetical protein
MRLTIAGPDGTRLPDAEIDIRMQGARPVIDVALPCEQEGCGARYVLPTPPIGFPLPRISELHAYAERDGWRRADGLGWVCPHDGPVAALPADEETADADREQALKTQEFVAVDKDTSEYREDES